MGIPHISNSRIRTPKKPNLSFSCPRCLSTWHVYIYFSHTLSHLLIHVHISPRCLSSLTATHRARALQSAADEIVTAAVTAVTAGGAPPAPHPTSGGPVVPGAAAAGGFLGVCEAVTRALVGAGGVSCSGSSCGGGVEEGDEVFWVRECTDMMLEVRRVADGVIWIYIPYVGTVYTVVKYYGIMSIWRHAGVLF